MSAHASHAPAGWYPNRGVLQYWDGVRWTEQTAPLSPVQPAPVVVQRTGAGSVAGGILLALLVVFVGVPALFVLVVLLLGCSGGGC